MPSGSRSFGRPIAKEGNFTVSFPGTTFTPDDGTGPGCNYQSPGAPAADYLAFGYWLYVPDDR